MRVDRQWVVWSRRPPCISSLTGEATSTRPALSSGGLDKRLRVAQEVVDNGEAPGSKMTNMNKHEEDELVNALRRRGDHQVSATTLSCTVAEYRSAARRVARQQGWRIRTFLIGDGQGIWVVWTDRRSTELERRAAMVAMGSGRPFDEVLKEIRRGNLRSINPE